ncbi:hypothetical protein [Jannaschia donghaensis]|uniref:Lipoprotein n=1 Tax=Jannaschia donghaensis TaxID=420998 RepID=A0A0M6YEQ4_9RHOB|nr:hypothetical protein [Jannaschia donghaensis]CTQ48440.1 hypothetical protein JDO7802_00442 [Jannaschia donghaensis]
MVPANKILTVAYGTFSCTLEGFDDPFSTMTDIAEYFRDLAADDRFFGAEPPTPDMAMLRTIAETRAKHAVTAQPEDGGITLRPTEMPAAAALTAAFDASDAAQTDVPALAAGLADTMADAVAEDETPEMAVVAEADVDDVDDHDDAVETPDIEEHDAEEQVKDASVHQTEDDATKVDGDDVPAAFMDRTRTPDDQTDMEQDDGVAAKLARIRGVVEADRQASTVYQEDEHADDMIADPVDMAEDTLVAAFAADALDDAPVADTDQDDADGVMTEGEDTLAADLSAILAPEVDAGTTLETEAVIQEDVAVVEEISVEETVTAAVPGPEEVEAAPAPDDTKAEEVAPAASGQPLQQRRIRVRKVRRMRAAAAAAAAETAAQEASAQQNAVDEEVAAAAEVVETSVGPATDEIAAPMESEVENDVAATRNVASDEDVVSDENVSSDEDEAEDELISDLAAIEAELTRDATGADETTDDTTDEDADISDEDDLMAELAAIRADEPDTFDVEEDDIVASIFGDDAEDSLDPDVTMALNTAEDLEYDFADAEDAKVETTEEDEVATDVEEIVGDADEATDVEAETVNAAEVDGEDKGSVPSAPDMERLFAATDSRLSGEDTSRRHANISHLKAAVAARRADGPIADKEDTETDAYRADLASTVRPRRSAPSVETAERTPRPERPAPLVLVSEQRVEDAPAADADPVQPRRAQQQTAEKEAQDVALAGAEDFEAFASDVGASELSDILEAAAVYSAKVMGQDNFSRPRLLHLAAEAVENMSREDGLRGFGQLLRDGTIRKVSRGTFALATDSRYAEEAERRVG